MPATKAAKTAAYLDMGNQKKIYMYQFRIKPCRDEK